MKKFLFLFIVLASILVTACAKPYMTPITIDIKNNETAFLVNLEGDSKNGQAKIDSLDYYENSKVQAKRITIAQRWEQTGKGPASGKFIPLQKLIVVDRSPVTQLWYSEATKVGDKPGFATETQTSVGITLGMQVSASVLESDAAKFLYWYPDNRPLKDIINSDVYASVGSLLSQLVATYTEDNLILKKNEWMATIKKQINDLYVVRGITIASIGQYGGIIFDNPAIQTAIDNKLIAAKDLVAAKDQVAAAQAKMGTLPYNAANADISYKNALANYINKAAEKGLNLVPQVSGANAGVILSMPNISK